MDDTAHTTATNSTAVRSRLRGLPGWQLLWSVALATCIVLASSRPRLASPVTFSHMDKVVHALIYGLMATLVVRVLFGSWPALRAALVAVVAVSLFGIADEFHQSFVPGRTADVYDWIVDTGGAMLAAALYILWPLYRRVLEWPLWGGGGDKSGLMPR